MKPLMTTGDKEALPQLLGLETVNSANKAVTEAPPGSESR
jgi:hypothetical protein